MILAAMAVAAQGAAAMPPADWTGLPEMPLRRPADPPPELSGYVRGEVAAGRCRAARVVGEVATLPVEMAVLVAADGSVRRVVPRAIDCPTLEQFAAGLVWRMARGNPDAAPGGTGGWYRAGVTFSWPAPPPVAPPPPPAPAVPPAHP